MECLIPDEFANFDRVNISIWNGTIIAKQTQIIDCAVVNAFFTRTIYQAHMEVHRMIRNTEPTVITSAPFSTLKKVCLFDTAEHSFPVLHTFFQWECQKALRLMYAFFLKEFIRTSRIGNI